MESRYSNNESRRASAHNDDEGHFNAGYQYNQEKRGKAGAGPSRLRSNSDNPNCPNRYPNSQCFKTKLCSFNQKGLCTRENCSFAHCETEIRAAPDLTKTKVCNNWKQGTCLQGDSCRFAHGFQDLRQHPDRVSRPLKQHISNGKRHGRHTTSLYDQQSSKVFSARDLTPPCQNRNNGNTASREGALKGTVRHRQSRTNSANLKQFCFGPNEGSDDLVSTTSTAPQSIATENPPQNHQSPTLGKYAAIHQYPQQQCQQQQNAPLDYYDYFNATYNSRTNVDSSSHFEAGETDPKHGVSAVLSQSKDSAVVANLAGSSCPADQPWRDIGADIQNTRVLAGSLSNADSRSPRTSPDLMFVAGSVPGSPTSIGSLPTAIPATDRPQLSSVCSFFNDSGFRYHSGEPSYDYFGGQPFDQAHCVRPLQHRATPPPDVHENALKAAASLTKSLSNWLAEYDDGTAAARALEACCPGQYSD